MCCKMPQSGLQNWKNSRDCWKEYNIGLHTMSSWSQCFGQTLFQVHDCTFLSLPKAYHKEIYRDQMVIWSFQVLCVFFLYIWCAAANPADPGVFKSKKYLSLYGSGKYKHLKESRKGSSDAHARIQLEGTGEKQEHGVAASSEKSMTQHEDTNSSCLSSTFSAFVLLFYPLSFVLSCCQSHEWSSEQQATEEGMFFCSLCEVQVCFLQLLALRYVFRHTINGPLFLCRCWSTVSIAEFVTNVSMVLIITAG